MIDDPDDVANREPKRGAPRFACFPVDENSQYVVYIESEILCVTHSFSQALMLWFISHYILNLEYCIKVREVALFFQEFVFKLPATSATKRLKSATYLSVTTDIINFVE